MYRKFDVTENLFLHSVKFWNPRKLNAAQGSNKGRPFGMNKGGSTTTPIISKWTPNRQTSGSASDISSYQLAQHYGSVWLVSWLVCLAKNVAWDLSGKLMLFAWRGKLGESVFGLKPVPRNADEKINHVHIVYTWLWNAINNVFTK